MPKNKHKRKASAHATHKTKKTPGLITSHPKRATLVGLFLVMVSVYLLIFESQDNAMFGLAMISLIIGMILGISVKMTATKKDKI
jgi:uncharacterized membrane protein